MNLELIKYQMEYSGVNAFYLHKLTGVGYATINDLLNGKRQLETLQAKNYNRIIDTLFTNTEQALITPFTTLEDYKKKYKKMIRYALNLDDCKVYLSGGTNFNDKNEPESMPAHIEVVWGYIEEGSKVFNIKVYNDDLYRSLINNKGQRYKKQKLIEKIS